MSKKSKVLIYCIIGIAAISLTCNCVSWYQENKRFEAANKAWAKRYPKLKFQF
jgi:uncharacterized membrane protein YuzA (DUF378 family)